MAKEFKLDVADKAESQDICFLSGGDYRDFLEQYGVTGKLKGEIVDMEGRVLAAHAGIQNFTVGQRRGLGLPGGGGGEKLYVTSVDPETNRVYVGTKEHLMKNTLTASNVIWTAGLPDDCIQNGLRTKAKIRYRHMESDVSVSLSGTDEVVVRFDKPQRAMTPGQAVVFYEDSRVLGGGWIKEVH